MSKCVRSPLGLKKNPIFRKISNFSELYFDHSFFTDIKNKFKVLIPIDSLENFDYYPEENVFKNDKLTICMDSNINCKLTSIKYEKKQFICIGELLL